LREPPPGRTEPAPAVLTVDELAALLRVNRKTVLAVTENRGFLTDDVRK
jgi:plasmid maintenance system antidote protein VapI